MGIVGNANAAKSIGRVGALAVALGVGWAVLSSSGTAWAETGDTAESSRSEGSSRSESSEPAKSSDSARADSSTTAGKIKPENDSQESVERDAHEQDSLDTQAAASDRRASKLRSGRGPDDSPSETSAGAEEAPESPLAPVVSIPLEERAPATSDVGGDPADPVESPISWVLAAAARRELATPPDSQFSAGVNTAPTASLDWQGTARWFAPNVRGRVTASDIDGDKLSYAGVVTAKGTLSVTSRGSFTFKPTAAARHAAAATAASAADKFQNLAITVSDGNGGVVSVPIRVEILPANKTPSWVRARANRPDSINGVVTGRVSATDGDGDVLTYMASNPSGGSVVINTDGSFVYRPTAVARVNAKSTWYTDTDQFSVTLDDGHGGVKTVSVKVTISPGDNQSPSLGSPLVTITSTDSSTGVVTGRVNASDPEGSPLVYRLSAGVPGGTGAVALDGNTGAFSFTPTEAARLAAYNTPGEDTTWFTVVVSDEQTSVSADIGVPIVAKAPPPPPPPPSNWTRPLASYRVTQEYGGSHTGIDLAASAGTPVYAAADGVIYHEGWGTSDRAGKPSDWMGTQAGISILVRHDGLGVMSGYAHLSRTIIDVGQRVSKGQLIGYVGCTGSCSGPHLHFEVLPMPLSSSRGILGRVNPRNYLSL